MRLRSIGLGVLLLPLQDLVEVDVQGVVFDPRGELVQPLAVVVAADPRVEDVVPAVQPADQVVALDASVGHQRAAVQAPAVEDGVVVAEADDHQVDVADEGAHRLTVGNLAPRRDLDRLHTNLPRSPSC